MAQHNNRIWLTSLQGQNETPFVEMGSLFGARNVVLNSLVVILSEAKNLLPSCHPELVSGSILI